jgi:hypothetical protein
MRLEDLVALDDDASEAMLRTMADWPKPTVQQVRHAILDSRMIVPSEQGDEHRPFFTSLPEAFERAVKEGKLFDLGHLPNAVIKSEAKRGGELLAAGHIGHPYQSPYCLYHTWEGGGSLYLVDASDWHAMSKGRMKPNTFLVCEAQGLTVAGQGQLLLGDSAMIEISPDYAGWSGKLVKSAAHRALEVSGLPKPTERESICNLVDPVAAMLLLLATDGVAVDKIEMPFKLNRTRAKNGKPHIPPYWAVRAEHYVTALGQRGKPGLALGGHHASPRPHLRRGHIRHLQSGSTVWIKDALVMLKEGQEIDADLGRNFYQQRDRK